jgi:hypothetical protein
MTAELPPDDARVYRFAGSRGGDDAAPEADRLAGRGDVIDGDAADPSDDASAVLVDQAVAGEDRTL